MKDNKIKEQVYKLHNSIVFLDKNVNNVLENKYLISLGYDETKIPGQIGSVS